MANGSDEQKAAFSESVGMVFSGFGMPRMAGRILGFLMIADPAHQSATQLVEGLGASKGSISTNTRIMLQMGFIEKIGIPGDRSTFYRMVDQPIEKLMELEMHGFAELRALSQEGLEIIGQPESDSYKRLARQNELWRFLEEEYPKLLQRYYETHSHKGEE